MNPPGLPAMAPGGAGLHTRRCVRHSTREAAARCPACGEFYCRECVVEHDGKFLCASCLAKKTKSSAERHERWVSIRRAVRTTVGVLALWLVFYWLGALLLKISTEFHEGTVWKKATEESSP
jgi:hypothetical protein